MINSSQYRGFTIIINVGSGGWIIQRLEGGPGPDQKWVQYASVPGSAEDPSAAIEWINAYLAKESS